MKKIMVVILLMTCTSPKPLVKSGDPSVDKIITKVKIVGDSNIVNISYYLMEIDTIKRDSL